MAVASDINFTRKQLSALAMPNGPKAIKAYAWMNDHFSFVGDEQPGKGEIHVDSVEKREVYGEYLLDFAANNMMDKSVKESTFLGVWQHCLPYVKIRKYKVRSMHITCDFILQTMCYHFLFCRPAQASVSFALLSQC